MKRFFALIVAVSLISSRSLADSGPYKLLKSVTVGGDGRWDYITVDSDNRKLYIPRTNADRTDVYDVDTLQKVGEIDDTNGVHGVAIDPESGHGFTSNRSDPSVTMFDLKTQAVIKKIPVTGKPDGIFFDPFGWGFYSPWDAFGAPYFGYGFGYGGYGYGGVGYRRHFGPGYHPGYAASGRASGSVAHAYHVRGAVVAGFGRGGSFGGGGFRGGGGGGFHGGGGGFHGGGGGGHR